MRIKKVFLQTAFIKTIGEFYSSILGLQVQSINDNEIRVRIGSSELVFTEAKGTEPFYHVAINIPSDKIDEAKEWLDKRATLLWIEDYKSEIADFVNWHAKSVYFFDPAGNILELIARFDLGNRMKKKFSPKQFLSISELGLVFAHEEFEQKNSQLLDNYSLSYFYKQPPMPHFRAIGDDEGLFI